MKKIASLIFIASVMSLVSCVGFSNNASKNDNSSEYSSSKTSDKSSSSYETDGFWDLSQNNLRTGTKSLDFYNFNDFHGATERYSNGSNSEPGISKLSTFIKGRRSLNPDGFVLTSSGDMWQGSADSNITKGRLVVDWMNYLSFDAQAIGNHEFDWKIDVMNSNQEMMDFPLLACNIVCSNTNKPVEWAKPYTTITRNGVHIGVIGAIGAGQTVDILSSNVEGLTFADPTNYIVQWSSYLKDNGADIVLLLLHDSCYSLSNAAADAVDLGFAGHTHTAEDEFLGSSGNVPFVQSYSNGKSVSYIHLDYDFSKKTKSNVMNSVVDLCSLSLADDKDTVSLYNRYLENEISIIKNRVVGHSSSKIYRSSIPNIYNQYAYKYYLDEIKGTDEIFAIECNDARSDIPAGDITYGNVYKALPFDNYLTLVKIKGQYIISHLSTYENAHFYLPSSKASVDSSGINNYVTSKDKYYYILAIDYISTSTYYSSVLEIKKTYGSESALPRNIVSSYLNDYPNNIA